MKDMEKWPKYFVANILLLTLFLSALATVSAQQSSIEYGPVQISTGNDEETPLIGLDSRGNVHIVWASADDSTLMYMMFDSSGGVLIDETNLLVADTPQEYHSIRPSMVIDANDEIHVVYHGWSNYIDIAPSGYGDYDELRSAEVMYLKFNPYLDNMDGSPADFYTITTIPEMMISTEDEYKSRAANMDIDSSGRLHIAWFDGGTNPWDDSEPDWEIHYIAMDLNGNTVVNEQVLATGFETDGDWSEPEIVADSQGNAHIFFVTEGWTGSSNNWRDVWYLMADGSDGSLLIAPTQLTDSNEQWRHSQPAVDIDSKDMIHVAYHDSRGDMAEIYRFVVNPYLDDLSGNAADPNVIVTEQPAPITTDDGYQSYMANINIDAWDREHVVWKDARDTGPADESNHDVGEIYYSQYLTIGETRITHFNETGVSDIVRPAYWWESSNRRAQLAASCSRVYVTFNGAYENDPEDGLAKSDIFFMILGIPPCTVPVGGELLIVDKFVVLAPVLAVIAASLVAATSFLFYYRRRL